MLTSFYGASTIFESFLSPLLGKKQATPPATPVPPTFQLNGSRTTFDFLKEKTKFIFPEISSYRYATLPSRKAMMAEAPRSGWLRITN